MKVVTTQNRKESELLEPVLEVQDSALSERLRLAINKFFELKHQDDGYSSSLNSLSQSVLNQSRSTGLLLAIISHLCEANEENYKYVTSLVNFYEKEVYKKSVFGASTQKTRKKV